MNSKRVTHFFRQITVCLLFLGGSLTAQPYSQPPYLFSDIQSEGNYDLSGKKFYISDVQYYSSNPARFGEQKDNFTGKLEESLILLGAVKASDSLSADFYILTSVDYWDCDTDITKSPAVKQKHLYSPYYNNMEGLDPATIWNDQRSLAGLPDIEMARVTVNTRDAKISKSTEQKQRRFINKQIILEAFEVTDGKKNILWMSKALNSREEGSKLQAPDDAMLFFLMRSYGKTVRPQKCVLSNENGYYSSFRKSEIGNSVSFVPSFISSDEKVGLLLIERRADADELVFLVEDNNRISSDLAHKNYTATLKQGDKLIGCSKMNYDVRPVKFSRLLEIVFPMGSVENGQVDLIIHKKGHPKKVKYSISGIYK